MLNIFKKMSNTGGMTLEEIELNNEICAKFRKFLNLAKEEREELEVEELTAEQTDELFHLVFLNKTQVDHYNEFLRKHNLGQIKYPERTD